MDENGRFEATLPSGTYEVKTEIPSFYPFRRAPFQVVGGTTLMLNLVPSRRYLVRGTTVSTKASVDEAAPRPKYEQVQVAPQSLPALIQFENRQNIGRGVTYRFAVFTYGPITIYADKLLLDRRALRLTASGKGIILEDGKQRIEIKGVTVSLDKGEAHLDLIKE